MAYKLFSDFSDTLALPLNGTKFPPFELELGKLIENELLPGTDRDKFTAKYQQGYEQFNKIRRDESIPYHDRVSTWLKPFANKLTLQHLNRLADSFKINQNFLAVTDILKQELNLNSLGIVVVSGTLTQLIEIFIKKRSVSVSLLDHQVSLTVEATKLIFDPKGIFTDEIAPTNEMVYIGPPAYPKNYLILGDNALENFGGFGKRLLNVQTFNRSEVAERIQDFKRTVQF